MRLDDAAVVSAAVSLAFRHQASHPLERRRKGRMRGAARLLVRPESS
jgi:hypothetical protein